MIRVTWSAALRWLGLAAILAVLLGLNGPQTTVAVVEAGSAGSLALGGVATPRNQTATLAPAPSSGSLGNASVYTASPGTVLRYMRVLGSAFHPIRSGITFESPYGSCTYMTSGIAYDYLQADLQLPEGAHIVGMRIWYYDSTGSDGIVALTEYDPFATENGTHEVALVSTSGSGSGGRDTTGAVDYVVRNADHALALRWRPLLIGSGMAICTVQLTYEVPIGSAAYLPAITR
jgi:hypothetical protein